MHQIFLVTGNWQLVTLKTGNYYYERRNYSSKESDHRRVHGAFLVCASGAHVDVL